MNASVVLILGFALVMYIVLYVVFLACVLLSSSYKAKLLRKYGSQENKRGRGVYVAIFLGGILGVVLFYLYVTYV